MPANDRTSRHSAIEKITAAAGFGNMLALSGLLLVPATLFELVALPRYVVDAASNGTDAVTWLVRVVLPIGGTIGFAGWIRANLRATPGDHGKITHTLLWLSIGVATAVATAGLMARLVTITQRGPLRASFLGVAVPFVVASAIWGLAAFGAMQRLMRGHEDRTGRAFDIRPVIATAGWIGLAASSVGIVAGIVRLASS